MDAFAFATTQNLDDWLGEEVQAPDDSPQLLRWATVIVARAANLDPYQAVADSAAQALADATCAQASPWAQLTARPWTVSTGLTPGTAPVKKSSILGADVEVDTSGQVKMLVDADCLTGQAEAILQQAGLLWQALPTGDQSPYLLRYGLSGPLCYDWGTQLAEWPWMT